MALKSGRVGIHPSQVDPITGMLINVPTPGNISFGDLSDAQIADPEVGQTLIYNGNKWENEFSSISPTTLAALQDVQITDPKDGDYLMYDSENSKWINSGAAPAPTYTDITVTLYGAVEDTISFIDAAGISHSEVFASGQSSKSVTFKINPSGSNSITFTSAVAKDPDNLSNDYTKTVSVTSATTSIYVMPNDNVLYWYGYKGSNFEETTTTNGWYNYGTYVAPTYNKNSMTFAMDSSHATGVGSKNAITATKCNIIYQNSNSSWCVWFNNGTPKNTNIGSVGTVTALLQTSITKESFNLPQSSTYLIVAGIHNSAATNTMYALWYE